MQDRVTIRAAEVEDAEKLLEIYAPYVKKTAISFEYEVPSVEEFAGRIKKTLQRYPYLVATMEGETAGYAYAGAFHARAAYQWCAEASIYVKEGLRGHGIGRKLYEALEEELRDMGILNLNACIAHPVQEDEYLTQASERFHERMGFSKVAEFHRCGYKFQRWYDIVWMEKLLGEHEEMPMPVRCFSAKRLLSKKTGAANSRICIR